MAALVRWEAIARRNPRCLLAALLARFLRFPCKVAALNALQVIIVQPIRASSRAMCVLRDRIALLERVASLLIFVQLGHLIRAPVG